MLRLFLVIVGFLATSAGGLWYSFSDSTPLDETAFENAPLTLEPQPTDTPLTESPAPQASAPVPVAEPERPPESQKPAGEAAAVKPAEAATSEPNATSGLSVQPRLLRFGYRVPPAPRTIDTIVLHSSYNALGGDPYLVDKVITEYEGDGVGAHYLIDRTGTVYRLIEEVNIAYHAGASKMPDGRKNVNDFSIGIEIIATEESGYTDKQYSAVNALVGDIKSRYKIKSVVGHADIAPGRKSDPWKFDWKKLKN
ncbi:MAG: N-acetylmuramoyl-L-alanine amidase [Candidatus Moraniibacteriota bacterium]